MEDGIKFCTNKGGFRRPGKKSVKVWSVVVAVAAARVEVAVVVVATMAVLLVSPLTLYRPSATVLFRYILKLIFSENKSFLKNS